MNLTVTQDNLYLFLPSKLSWMAEMLAKEKNIEIDDAIFQIYLSDTYRQLEKEDTKLWHWGPTDLYRKYKA